MVDLSDIGGGGQVGSIGGAAASGAAAGSVLGPYGMAAGAAIGIGLELIGGADKYKAAKQQTDAQVAMIQLQQKQDAVRQEMMHVQGRRASMEVFRKAQQQAALGKAASVNQGAQYGSGAAGGQAQVRDEAGVNLLGIKQNVMAGDEMFMLENQLDYQKILYAQAGGTMATGQGLSTLGGGILQSLPALKGLTGPSPVTG